MFYVTVFERFQIRRVGRSSESDRGGSGGSKDWGDLKGQRGSGLAGARVEWGGVKKEREI
jgi:hypothetical protein